MPQAGTSDPYGGVSMGVLLAMLLRGAVAYGQGIPARGHDWPGLLGPTRDGRSAETGLDLGWGEGGPPVLWGTSVGLGFSGPVIAGERVFFFDREGEKARLRALDAKTGAELWQSTYPTSYEDSYGFSPGPRALRSWTATGSTPSGSRAAGAASRRAAAPCGGRSTPPSVSR